MNLNEMKYEVRLRIHRLSSGYYDEVDDIQLDSLINKGTIQWLKERYGQRRERFETSQKRIDELKSLHVKSPQVQPAIPPANIIPAPVGFSYEFPLSSLTQNYLFLTRARFTITKNGCDDRIASHDQEQTDDRARTFNGPSFKWKRVVTRFGTGSSGGSSLYAETTADFSITYGWFDYIKFPWQVFSGTYNHVNGDPLYVQGGPQIGLDVDPGFHEEIVEYAAAQFFADIQNVSGYRFNQPLKQVSDDD